MVEPFRNLSDFTRWFIAQPMNTMRPPLVPVRHFVVASETGEPSSIISLVLYRRAPYQVEQFVIPATERGGSFPVHRHPNVDTYEFHLGGEIYLSVNGRQFLSDELIAEVSNDGAQLVVGVLKRVKQRDWHGARIGPRGGSFLSLQRWADGVEITSVGLDWIGPEHLAVAQ